MFNLPRRGRSVAALMIVLLACTAAVLHLPVRTGAQTQTFTISGRVDSNGFGTGTPISGVTMTLSQAGTPVATQQTDGNGFYSFTGIAGGGNYTIAAAKPGFSFFPDSRGYNNLSQSWPSQHFAGTALSSATVQFSAGTYFAPESANFVQITVTRSSTAGASTVRVASTDGSASRKRDYNAVARTLRFADGESSKSFNVLLTNDVHVENDETVTLTLSQPVGADLGTPSTATLTIHSDDGPGLPNPIDEAQFFVRMHYHDFLNREPDAGGLGFWSGEITACGSDAQCVDVKRQNVSAAFFLSIEFQETGYLVYRLYKAAYGDATPPGGVGTVPIIRFDEFFPDTQAIGEGVEVGVGDWFQRLEANKAALVLEFVGRQRFVAALPASMTPTQFVDRLNQNAGGVLDATERQTLVDQLTANNTTAGRAAVLRRVADDENLRTSETNRAFVLMQYFGYLQRDADDTGFNGQADPNFDGYRFWLQKLNDNQGNFVSAEMVKAFLVSIEYRQRFGQ